MDRGDEAIARALLEPADAKTARFEHVTAGMSGAAVIRIIQEGRGNRFAKIAGAQLAGALRGEIARTRWLSDHGISVPRILRTHEQTGHAAVLMEALPGIAADACTLPASRLIEALAAAMAALHSLPSHDCPYDETLNVRLARAKAAVASGEIDISQFEPRNRDIAPAVLLERLMARQPPQDIVIVHGDATLSNLIVSPQGNVGFIDCGNAGRGDRYIDLAVLAADIAEHYGDGSAAQFTRRYGGTWDAAKAAFYSDLYEFF